MNISLTPELEKMIRRKVAKGRYVSVSEVVREALRLLAERDQQQESHLDALRREIAIGVQELDQGKSAPLDIEAVKSSAHKKLARKKLASKTRRRR